MGRIHPEDDDALRSQFARHEPGAAHQHLRYLGKYQPGVSVWWILAVASPTTSCVRPLPSSSERLHCSKCAPIASTALYSARFCLICCAMGSMLADRSSRQKRSRGRDGDALLIRQDEAKGLWDEAAVVTE